MPTFIQERHSDQRPPKSATLPQETVEKVGQAPYLCSLVNRITQHIGSQSHFFNSLPTPD
jgi:hypothetical protein